MALTFWSNCAVAAESTVRFELVEDGRQGTVYLRNELKFHVTAAAAIKKVENATHNLDPKKLFVIPPGKRVAVGIVRQLDRNRRWSYDPTFRYRWGNYYARHSRDLRYWFPFEGKWRVSQGFNGKSTHKGINQYAVDFDMPEGTPVLAARAGVVTEIRQDETRGSLDPKMWGKGNFVQICHSDGTLASYFHLKPESVEVKPGQVVKPLQPLALSGNTGFTKVPHLHFVVQKPASLNQWVSIPIQFATGFPKEGESYENPKPAEKGR